MDAKAEPAADSRRWLSVPGLAKEFGVSKKTLYRAIAAGKFPAVRISEGRIVVPPGVLEELAERARVTGRLVDVAEWAEVSR